MNITRRILIGIACASGIWSTAWAGQITFQGLSGSSTWADVQARFPNARRERSIGCKPDERTEAAGPDHTVLDCEELDLSNYDVLGMNFDVGFTFDGTTHKLLFVNLVHWWAYPNDPENNDRLTKSDILDKYMKLRAILISNHGAPTPDPFFSCESATAVNYHNCDWWYGAPGIASPNGTLFPDTSLGSITLEVDARKSNESDPTYGGSFEISYVLKPQFNGL